MNGVETCTPNKCMGLYRNLNYPQNWWELLHPFAHHRPTFWETFVWGTFVGGFLLTELFSIEGNLNLGRLWIKCKVVVLWLACEQPFGRGGSSSRFLRPFLQTESLFTGNLSLLLFWRSYCRRHLPCVNSLPHILTGCITKSGEASF